MTPEIIGQACGDLWTIIVLVKQTDDGPFVKILNLKRGTVSEETSIAELVLFMPCEDYAGAAILEEILETHQLNL